jgi:hypothetical protein
MPCCTSRTTITTSAWWKRELASLPATVGIPVVIFSSDADEVIAQLVAEGAAEAVPKPFNIHKFLAMLDRYFSLPLTKARVSTGTLTRVQDATKPS